MWECQCLILRREHENYIYGYISTFVKSATWGKTLTQRVPAFSLLVLITLSFVTHTCCSIRISSSWTLLAGTLPLQPTLHTRPDLPVSEGATEAFDFHT